MTQSEAILRTASASVGASGNQYKRSSTNNNNNSNLGGSTSLITMNSAAGEFATTQQPHSFYPAHHHSGAEGVERGAKGSNGKSASQMQYNHHGGSNSGAHLSGPSIGSYHPGANNSNPLATTNTTSALRSKKSLHSYR